MNSKGALTIYVSLVAIVFKENFAVQGKSNNNSQSPLVEARVITDYEDVLQGVSIDFGYNESESSGSSLNGFRSVPGCPKSDEGYPWVYYGIPPRCYLTGEQRPCDENQIISVKNSSIFGFCNCACFKEVGYGTPIEEDKFCTQRQNKEFVFMASLGKCFKLFDQGPCDKDQWIVKNSYNKNDMIHTNAKCQTRKCPPGDLLFLEDGKEGCSTPISVASVAVSILSSSRKECESLGKRYSDLLKKCIDKFNIDF